MANLPTSIKNLNTLLGEQLTEGEGGGSSDFSTAEVEVTIIGNIHDVTFPLPVLAEAQGDLPAAIVVGNISTGHTLKAFPTVPLYKGVCDVSIWGEASVQCTGNAEYVSGHVHITGDCTITVGNIE